MSKECDEIVSRIKKLENAHNIAGMARFGISSKNTYGVPVLVLRGMAKDIGKNHSLAQELWKTGIHEARILATIIDDPLLVSEMQADAWVRDFDSWDVCDQACMNLFDKAPFAHAKAKEWAGNEAEFVRRAGFALMAALASHDKASKDDSFIAFFPYIIRYSDDDRNFVRKSVNWALRGIGKRNIRLNKAAIACAKYIRKRDSKAARWIAADALRELQGAAVQDRLKARPVRLRSLALSLFQAR